MEHLTINQDYFNYMESESISIFWEAAAQFENPVILFSGGKDSTTLVHLAKKAFAPAKIPFRLLHIDTGHNFQEALDFRDKIVEDLGVEIIIRKVEDTIIEKGLQDASGKFPSRNWLQSHTLLDVIDEFEIDACIGGGRRDEEKARAKERIFSVRNEFGEWDPKQQRPELWNIFNGRIHKGENMRVFPISNWTELDVWNYIKRENIQLPPIYFSHKRKMVSHKNSLLAYSEFLNLDEDDVVMEKLVRYRTVGDMTCTAAVESHASTVEEVIEEIKRSRISERGETRIDDQVTDSAMEDRKKGGYF